VVSGNYQPNFLSDRNLHNLTDTTVRHGPLPPVATNLTVSIKSWHYVHLFILHMRNDECKSTV